MIFSAHTDFEADHLGRNAPACIGLWCCCPFFDAPMGARENCSESASLC
jgi:hypothetical protein